MYDICVIGGGAVGCAVAREATRYRLRVLLLEREDDVAEGISKANSGVVHAGFNVRPGSLKAKLNVEGLHRFPAITDDLDVPYKLTGKLVLARTDAERVQLERLLENGRANGVPGLSIVDGQAVSRIQPGVRAKWALRSERTAVISPYEFTIALAENAAANGADVRLGAEVVAVSRADGAWALRTARGTVHHAAVVVNSAGMDADTVGSMPAPQERRVYPCRGEYYILDVESEKLLRTAVYPVPPLDGSGLGVHLTPTINGNVLIGPSAEYIDDRHDVANTREVMESIKREAYELMPDLAGVPVIKNYSGIRPKLFAGAAGVTFEDFVIEEHPRAAGFINLLGIESPGLTAAPAIARYVLEELVSRRIDLEPNPAFDPTREGIIRTRFVGFDRLARLWAEDPDYGEVVCRCEQVTRAEVLRALANPLGARSLSAVKKRTHAMTGRCQSGYCLPRLLDIQDEVSP